MNSRQKRKAYYDANHEAPTKNHWVKESPWGEIPKHDDGNIKHYLREMKALGLYTKHTGSKPLYKIKNQLNTARNYQGIANQFYKTMMESQKQDNETISDAVIIDETN